MAIRWQMKRGPLSHMPVLQEGELYFATDQNSNPVYVGTSNPTQVIRLTGSKVNHP